MGATVADAELYESGHVARQLGIAVETLRSWERRKVIAPPLRTAGGRRVFRRQDVEAIREAQATRQAARPPHDAA